MQLLLWDADQTVIGTDVDIAVSSGERSDARRRQTVANRRPTRRLAIIEIQTLSQCSGEDVTRSDEHRVGVDFKLTGAYFKRLEMPGTIETEDPRSVCADHPLGADRHNRGDPVVLQVG